MKLKEKKYNLLSVLPLFFLAIWGCHDIDNNNPPNAATNDTVQLIQTMLNDTQLYDSIFSDQVSQKPIIHQNQFIQANYKLQYRSTPVMIRPEKFKKNDIDIDHPRFLIVVGKLEISDLQAVLTFGMPDVGMGIDTYWKRSDKSASWKLLKWDQSFY